MSVVSKNSPGALITFEGGDGCGKSTHIKFLASLLEDLGFDVLLVREPGATKIGESLRSILLDAKNEQMFDRTELLIYEAARAQLVNEVIAPALCAGKVVLCDRFTDSTVAYQGYGRGIDISFIEALNAFASCGIEPDVTIILYCSDRSIKRGRVERREDKDRLELAGDLFHTRVIDGFSDIAKRSPERVTMIDTQGKHSQTAREIFAALAHVIPELGKDIPGIEDILMAYDAAHDHSNDNLIAHESKSQDMTLSQSSGGESRG